MKQQPPPLLQHADAGVQQSLRALQQCPQGFGHPVQEVQWIETHISWLLLAGDFVYKFKKPLKLDFLDFSTVARRHAACAEELRINRRTAPDLYLGLVGLGHDEEGCPRLWPWDQAPQGAEPAVRMRRFAQEALLARVLARGALTPAQMQALAQHIAQFQAQAQVARPGMGWGTAQAVQAPVHEVLAALQAPPPMGCQHSDALAAVSQWCAQAGARLTPVFAQRLAAGRVRECHGDLHLGNLVLLHHQPQLFDAIEFNPALRWIDTVADIAFLDMDLQARGRPDLAWYFLNAWLEASGDYEGLRVLQYYRVYRALVRARVAGMRREQAQGDPAMEGEKEQSRYLALANGFIQPRPVGLWLTHGFSGAGKSTHSLVLACQRGMVRLRADVERKRLFGLAALDSSGEVAGGMYTPQATQRTHEHLERLARMALSAGYAVLVDATLLQAAQRQRFVAMARTLGVPCRILCFEAPLAVLRERVRARQRAGGDASEADEQVLEAQWATAQPLTADEQALAVHVDTTQPVDWARILPTAADGPASGAAEPLS